MLADKREMNYSRCLYWMTCRLCFSLLRSAIMCLRGHRSTVHRPTSTSIDLAYPEGRLNANALEYIALLLIVAGVIQLSST